MSEDQHGHDDHDHDRHSPKHYIRIWAVLMVLLFISITGPMLEIAIITLITAFGVAGVKAFLVMKHFMHLDVEKPFVIYILTTSCVFMMMFFAAVGVDVMNHEGARWSNVAATQAIARGLAAGDPAHHHGSHGGHGDDAAHGGDHAPDAGHDDAHEGEVGHDDDKSHAGADAHGEGGDAH
jgi:caa(3)-type oxidase subunit IV